MDRQTVVNKFNEREREEESGGDTFMYLNMKIV